MKRTLIVLTLLSYTAQAEIIIDGSKVTCTSNCSTTITPGGGTVMCSGSSCVTISAGGIITVGGSNPVQGKQHK